MIENLASQEQGAAEQVKGSWTLTRGALNLVVDGVGSGLNFQQVNDLFARGFMMVYLQHSRDIDMRDSDVF